MLDRSSTGSQEAPRVRIAFGWVTGVHHPIQTLSGDLVGDYRMVVRHVRYWRGTPHKWSQVFPFTGSISAGNYGAAINALHVGVQQICFQPTSATYGGNYAIALYNSATGGVPVAVTTYFDPDTTSAWVQYDGSAWGTHGQPAEAAAEVAMGIRWAAGLSSSGKPVYFRKWVHAVPISTAAPGVRDISTTAAGAIANAMTSAQNAIGALGLQLGNGSRLASLSPVVEPYYENHQMPRGRRRLVRAAARPASSFPPSLLVVPGSDGSLEA